MVIKKLLMVVLVLLCCLFSTTSFASFQYGDEGQEIVAIQKRLSELNYTIVNIDGNFGSETERAIKSFQAEQGLEVDGIVGELTYKALMNKEMPPNRSNSPVRTVLRTAYSVLGSPYMFGGTSPYGFDCSGFTKYAFARVGVHLPRTADAQLSAGRQIPLQNLRPGDLIFFTTYEPGASHVGIYLGNGKFIHSGSSTGVAIASAFTGYWGARYYGACRIL